MVSDGFPVAGGSVFEEATRDVVVRVLRDGRPADGDLPGEIRPTQGHLPGDRASADCDKTNGEPAEGHPRAHREFGKSNDANTDTADCDTSESEATDGNDNAEGDIADRDPTNRDAASHVAVDDPGPRDVDEWDTEYLNFGSIAHGSMNGGYWRVFK